MVSRRGQWVSDGVSWLVFRLKEQGLHAFNACLRDRDNENKLSDAPAENDEEFGPLLFEKPEG